MAREVDLVFLDTLFERMKILVEIKTLDRLTVRAAGWTAQPGLRERYARRFAELENKLIQLTQPVSDDAEMLSFKKLEQYFHLDWWELQTLAIAAAPRFDILFQDLFARFHMEPNHTYCSVNTCLHVLFPTRIERWRHRRMFLKGSSLIETGLIRLGPATSSNAADLMEWVVIAPEYIFDTLVGELSVDDFATSLWASSWHLKSR
ncbi:MAG: hypothetical protein MJE77_22305 [Proteobacteria bacterium]|nr:hypothetical protein [Pseudomonadota bacterium]